MPKLKKGNTVGVASDVANKGRARNSRSATAMRVQSQPNLGGGAISGYIHTHAVVSPTNIREVCMVYMYINLCLSIHEKVLRIIWATTKLCRGGPKGI